MPKTKTGEVITWSEFFKRWKKGFSEIKYNPIYVLKMRVSMIYGTLISLIIAILYTFFTGIWYMSLFLVFYFGVQVTQVFEEKQKIKAIEDAHKQTAFFLDEFKKESEEKNELVK